MMVDAIRKQGLVHLHELLYRMREYLATSSRHAVPAEAFESYRGLGIAPHHVHRSKAAHEEAISRLLDGLLRAIEATESVPSQTARRGNRTG